MKFKENCPVKKNVPKYWTIIAPNYNIWLKWRVSQFFTSQKILYRVKKSSKNPKYRWIMNCLQILAHGIIFKVLNTFYLLKKIDKNSHLNQKGGNFMVISELVKSSNNVVISCDSKCDSMSQSPSKTMR